MTKLTYTKSRYYFSYVTGDYTQDFAVEFSKNGHGKTAVQVFNYNGTHILRSSIASRIGIMQAKLAVECFLESRKKLGGA